MRRHHRTLAPLLVLTGIPILLTPRGALAQCLFPVSSLDGTSGFAMNGIDQGDNTGISVSSAGDVNADGIDDVIIGAYTADPGGISNAGESYVVFGRDVALTGPFPGSLDLASLDGTNGFVIEGVDPGDSSGEIVAHAGDFNADGADDILIGAYRADPNSIVSAGDQKYCEKALRGRITPSA